MDVQCSIDLEWSSAESSRTMIMAPRAVWHSAFGTIDGYGGGPTPETLLIAAISSSYGIALSKLLRTASLPQTRVSVRGSGTIGSSGGRAHFSRVVLSPTIHDADLSRRETYESAATAARDDCLIGRSIRGNVAYVIGDVVLLRSTE